MSNVIWKCKLDSGEIVEFDICSRSRNILAQELYEYLGEGRMYSVDGNVGIGKQQLHFFRCKPIKVKTAKP